MIDRPPPRLEAVAGLVWRGRFAWTGAAAALLLAIGLLAPASRTLQVVSLAAALAALSVIGARIAGALLPDEDQMGRCLPALTAAFGAAILLATGLGHFGLLGHRGWFLGLAAALLASLLLPRPRPTAPAMRPARPSGAEIAERVLMALAIGAVVASLATRMREQRFEPVGLVFDDASYHLTAVATWDRFGDLRMWKFPVGDGGTTFYPIGGELWSWTLLVPFRDSDVLARWAQLPFALGTLLALLAIGRRLGLPLWTGALAALLLASNQEAFSVLALGAGNDCSTAFLALAALDGLLIAWRRRTPGSFAVPGIALGLLAGTKYLGFLHAATLGALLAAGCLGAEACATARGRRRLAGGLLLTAAVIGAVGGYTYLRNLMSVGNPWFPLPVLGLPGWPGVSAAERAAAPEFQIEPWRFLTRRPDLFGPLFAFTLLPAAVIAPLLAAARRRWREALVFSVPVIFFLQFLFFTPDHRHLRYFLAGLAVAALALVWLVEMLPRWWRWSARVAILIAVLWQVLQQVPIATPDGRRGAAVGVIAAVAAAWLLLGRPGWSSGSVRRWVAASLALLPLLGAPALASYVDTYQERKLVYAPAPAALESLTQGAGAGVAYVGHNRPYLFHGRRLQNQVEAVPRSGPPESRYYDWGDAGDWPYERGRFQRWQRNLRALDIAYVVVVSAGEAVPERGWMLERPGEYEPVFQWREFEIFRVTAAGDPAALAGARL